MNLLLSRHAGSALVVLVILAATTRPSHAQGWPNAPGTGGVSIGYQVTDVRNHLFSSTFNPRGRNVGNSRDLGQILGQSVELSTDYVLIPNLSLSASVAWVGARYTGIRAESATLDDGKFHGTLQDASLGTDYTFATWGFAVTPGVSISFPTHDYEHHGHAAPGSHNTSAATGVTVARSLGPWLKNGYTAVSYSHAFVQNIENWGLDANRYGVSVGYSVLPQLNVRGFFSYFEVTQGIDWSFDDLSAEVVDHFHDAAAKTLVRRAGGSLNYRLGATRTVFADVSGVLSGQNTHDGVTYTLGSSWNFVSPFAH